MVLPVRHDNFSAKSTADSSHLQPRGAVGASQFTEVHCSSCYGKAFDLVFEGWEADFCQNEPNFDLLVQGRHRARLPAFAANALPQHPAEACFLMMRVG